MLRHMDSLSKPNNADLVLPSIRVHCRVDIIHLFLTATAVCACWKWSSERACCRVHCAQPRGAEVDGFRCCAVAIMTLPANDAFSLGLAHDQPRRASSRSRTPSLPRPSSPKILFASPPATPSPAPLPGGMPKRTHRRKHSSNQHNVRVSNGESTIEELVEEADDRSPVAPKRKSKHARTHSAPNGHAPQPNGVHRPNTIDWEVPRKALHSSIGVSPCARDPPPVHWELIKGAE